MLRFRRSLSKLFTLVIFIIIILLYLTSKTSNKIKLDKTIDSHNFSSKTTTVKIDSGNRLNGCILILVSNKHLHRLYSLIQRLELVFNKNYNYPYIIFHYENINNRFKNEIANYTNSTIEFGLIPKGKFLNTLNIVLLLKN